MADKKIPIGPESALPVSMQKGPSSSTPYPSGEDSPFSQSIGEVGERIASSFSRDPEEQRKYLQDKNPGMDFLIVPDKTFGVDRLIYRRSKDDSAPWKFVDPNAGTDIKSLISKPSRIGEVLADIGEFTPDAIQGTTTALGTALGAGIGAPTGPGAVATGALGAAGGALVGGGINKGIANLLDVSPRLGSKDVGEVALDATIAAATQGLAGASQLKNLKKAFRVKYPNVPEEAIDDLIRTSLPDKLPDASSAASWQGRSAKEKLGENVASTLKGVEETSIPLDAPEGYIPPRKGAPLPELSQGLEETVIRSSQDVKALTNDLYEEVGNKLKGIKLSPTNKTKVISEVKKLKSSMFSDEGRARLDDVMLELDEKLKTGSSVEDLWKTIKDIRNAPFPKDPAFRADLSKIDDTLIKNLESNIKNPQIASDLKEANKNYSDSRRFFDTIMKSVGKGDIEERELKDVGKTLMGFKTYEKMSTPSANYPEKLAASLKSDLYPQMEDVNLLYQRSLAKDLENKLMQGTKLNAPVMEKELKEGNKLRLLEDLYRKTNVGDTPGGSWYGVDPIAPVISDRLTRLVNILE